MCGLLSGDEERNACEPDHVDGGHRDEASQNPCKCFAVANNRTVQVVDADARNQHDVHDEHDANQ